MSNFKFTCPNCNQYLEALPEVLGQTVECPLCKGHITLSKPASQQQVVRMAAPPQMPAAQQPPQTCTLCGNGKYMFDARMLYGHLVCRKCYYSFANRRQLAYFLDLLCFWVFTFIVVFMFNVLMIMAGSSQSKIHSVNWVLGWILTPAFLFKDCFSGQSLGKATCGVKVIDETTGEPGGIGASLKRNLPLVIPFMPLIVAFQLCKGHRTGDGWSNTKVIWKKYATHPIFSPTQTQT